jgi:hypothetical protein
MKKKIFIGIGALVLVIAGGLAYFAIATKSHSPAETKTFTYNGADIKVVYCRPYKKGRVIFGEDKDGALQPYGKYWRLGANEATEISFSKNVNFAGQPVNAGTYSMYAVPGSTNWQVVLNSELAKWGAREADHALDVLKVEVPVDTTPETEQFTITFNSDSTAAIMNFAWDKALVRVPITVQ